MLPRRTKIVCTIGPASHRTPELAALVRGGMDVARLNFSHGSHEDHREVIAELRRLSDQLDRPLAILQDLQGPKIRVGRLQGGSLVLKAGATVVVTTRQLQGDSSLIPTDFSSLPADVAAGDEILLNDGLLRLRVQQTTSTEVHCEVVDGGLLRERAGMNLPGTLVSTPALTEKDRDDLEFGLRQGVDFIALSFVRRSADITELKELIAECGAHTPVVAKLEKPQAIDSLDDILRVADAVMIARGDLGVELSPERVPFLQKEILTRAASHRVPVITATQMLESMIDHPRPTRAEASDVANAIFDGTDAVMLSGETAIGQHPIEALLMMDRIVVDAESHGARDAPTSQRHRDDSPPSGFPDAAAAAACRAADEIKARAIVAFTTSGFTARLISKYRPRIPIYAWCENRLIYQRLALYWGVEPRLADFAEEIGERVEFVDATLREAGELALGEPFVVLAGMPSGVPGTTNMLLLHRSGFVQGDEPQPPSVP